jgi:hypothetical protein
MANGFDVKIDVPTYLWMHEKRVQAAGKLGDGRGKARYIIIFNELADLLECLFPRTAPTFYGKHYVADIATQCLFF